MTGADPLIDAFERNELVKEQHSARTRIYHGVVMLAFVPLTIVGALLLAVGLGHALPAMLAFVCAAIYSLIGSIGGIAMITSGSLRYRRARRELRAIDEPRLLPVARVVER